MDWVAVEKSGFPERFPARIDVVTIDGRSLSATAETVRGAPGRPIPREEIVAKFSRNADRQLPGERAEAILDAVMGPGAAPDLARLSAVLSA